jgi:hypothetical protein
MQAMLLYRVDFIMPIVLVRHGSVKTNEGKPDELTPSGEAFADRLPAILLEHGIKPSMVFFDASVKWNRRVERCKETVRGLITDHVQTEGYVFNDPNSVLSKCREADHAVICYTSESLKYFPKLHGTFIESYTGDAELPNPPRTISPMLYRSMIVVEFRGDELHQVRTIPTGETLSVQ